MRHLLLLTVFAFALLICPGCHITVGLQDAGIPPVVSTRVSSAKIAGQELRYRVSVPDESGRPEAGWPMLLFLHGAGERGTDLELLSVHGPLPLVGQIPELSECVIVAPQCPAGTWWETDALKDLMDEVMAAGGIDGSRLYVTGISMGGYATWGMLERNPELFAAAVPICGGGNTERVWAGMGNGFKLENLLLAKDVPIHAFHGEDDQQIPAEESRFLIDALHGVGSEAKLTLYPGVGHNSWTRTYEKPELYRWMFAQRK